MNINHWNKIVEVSGWIYLLYSIAESLIGTAGQLSGIFFKIYIQQRRPSQTASESVYEVLLEEFAFNTTEKCILTDLLCRALWTLGIMVILQMRIVLIWDTIKLIKSNQFAEDSDDKHILDANRVWILLTTLLIEAVIFTDFKEIKLLFSAVELAICALFQWVVHAYLIHFQLEKQGCSHQSVDVLMLYRNNVFER